MGTGTIFSFLGQNLPSPVVQIIRLSMWLVLLSAIFLPLERLAGLHPQRIFRKAVLTDLAYYFLNGVSSSILLSVPLGLLAWAVQHFIPVGFTSAVAAAPAWMRIGGALVVGEVGFYWGHRWSHEIPLLWRFHSIHHSAEEMDWLVSTRAHPVDMVFTRLYGLIPLYLLGLASPLRGNATLIPLLVILAGTVWSYFVHANLRWRFGPLEWVVATPAFHHWHHAHWHDTNDGPAYVNKNYAPMLPWVDRIFGTLYLPREMRPARYGMDEPQSKHLAGQLLDPFLPPRIAVQLSKCEVSPWPMTDAQRS